MKKVSIIINYNVDRGWLHEAVASVHAQDYPNVELIEEHGPGKTASENANNGIARSTGDYIKYLSEDDFLTTDCVSRSVETLESTGVDFIHGNAYNFRDVGGHRRVSERAPVVMEPKLRDFKYRNPIHGGTLMYTREALMFVQESRGFIFDQSLIDAEETDLNMFLLSHGRLCGYCPHFLYWYRLHDKQGSMGRNVDQMKRAERINAVISRYF
jgi:teichuronic acid biosynthesis glycosyltransferase TuaG